MNTLIKSVLLASSLSMSAVAISQTLSLDEYYSDYLTTENQESTSVSTSINSSAANKILLTEYYAEYCADNDTPIASQAAAPLANKTEPTNTCDNYYAEYLK